MTEYYASVTFYVSGWWGRAGVPFQFKTQGLSEHDAHIEAYHKLKLILRRKAQTIPGLSEARRSYFPLYHLELLPRSPDVAFSSEA